MTHGEHRLHVFGGDRGFALCSCNLEEAVVEAEQMLADTLGCSSELVVSRSTAQEWLAEQLGAERGMRPDDPGVDEFIELILDVVWRRCGIDRKAAQNPELQHILGNGTEALAD